MKWSPSTHKLCSKLARQQVFLVLLMCHRAERRVGYPFPKELKAMIINEMLAPPTEEFIRSVVPKSCVGPLLDRCETICFRGFWKEKEVVAQAAELGLRVVHSMTLYFPDLDGMGFPMSQLPEGADPSKYSASLYLTFSSAEEAGRYPSIPLLAGKRAFTCSPAELSHVPYQKNTLTRDMVFPFDGAVSLFLHQFRNRPMCEAASALAGGADDLTSLEVATCFHLG